jgi:mono/diheme cytochrome c family protein
VARLIGLCLLACVLASPPVLATEAAQADYMLNCQGCHLADGRGYPARQVPSLRGRLGEYLHVPGGREFLVQVPGAAQSSLSDAQLAQVLNWMLYTFSPQQLPDDFIAYSATEVQPLRQQPLARVSQIRQALQAQITLNKSAPTVPAQDTP